MTNDVRSARHSAQHPSVVVVQLRPDSDRYPEKCLIRRNERPCQVSTYVRSVASVGVSSTRVPPILLSHKMLKLDRSAVASSARGVYMTSHTHLEGFVDGTNRSEGVKSTAVPASGRRTSACTFIVDWSGV